jgi:hypothetical protein
VKFAVENKPAVENLLGFEVRSDIRAKAIQQLNEVLKLIGIRVIGAGTAKASGQKIYKYRLDRNALKKIRGVIADRDQGRPWPTLRCLYNWALDDAEDDQAREEGEID